MTYEPPNPDVEPDAAPRKPLAKRVPGSSGAPLPVAPDLTERRGLNADPNIVAQHLEASRPLEVTPQLDSDGDRFAAPHRERIEVTDPTPPPVDESRLSELLGRMSSGPPGAAIQADPAEYDQPHHHVVYRIAFRLIGSPSEVDALIAREAPALDPPPPRGWSELLYAAHVAVEAAQTWRTQHAVKLVDLRGIDPHAAHRQRLSRELNRWPTEAQAILALRCLADLSVEEISASTGFDDSQIRDVTVSWMPEDAESLGLLADLGQWIGGESTATDAFVAAPPLAFLDDVYTSAVA